MIKSAKELIVYQKGHSLVMRIFYLRKKFADERFALVPQIRRSSRSVCMNLREAWPNGGPPPHFISKLSDCDEENSETDTSLDFALDCGYITEKNMRRSARNASNRKDGWINDEDPPNQSFRARRSRALTSDF